MAWDFYKKCMRVLKVTKKPNSKEFKDIVKVSGIGIGIIGFLGFLISIVKIWVVG
jgi:protein transport protein SEC61 subunit gamma-like protein